MRRQRKPPALGRPRLEVRPPEFMVALQVDARLMPPPGAVPLLVIKVTPVVPGAFAPIGKIQWRLP